MARFGFLEGLGDKLRSFFRPATQRLGSLKDWLPDFSGGDKTIRIEADPTPSPLPTPPSRKKRSIPTPSPTSTPQRRAVSSVPIQPLDAGGWYRNPQWDDWRVQNPRSFEELLSGTRRAGEEYGVPQDLLMDLAGLESGGRPIDQIGGPAQGYYQFEPETIQSLGISGFNPYSATDSARLAARLIKNNQLSRWGIPRDMSMDIHGKYWGVLDNPNRELTLADLYEASELNKYLTDDYQLDY